jgi:hypothetical protein
MTRGELHVAAGPGKVTECAITDTFSRSERLQSEPRLEGTRRPPPPKTGFCAWRNRLEYRAMCQDSCNCGGDSNCSPVTKKPIRYEHEQAKIYSVKAQHRTNTYIHCQLSQWRQHPRLHSRPLHCRFRRQLYPAFQPTVYPMAAPVRLLLASLGVSRADKPPHCRSSAQSFFVVISTLRPPHVVFELLAAKPVIYGCDLRPGSRSERVPCIFRSRWRAAVGLG